MEKIRVFTDKFWNGWNNEDNIFTHILKQKYEVIIDSVNPQIVINATRTKNYKNAINIYYAGEPDWYKGENDYGFVGFNIMDDTYYRFPLYLSELYDCVRYGKTTYDYFYKKHNFKKEDINDNFACFIHSNGSCEFRNELFMSINNNYKKVDSHGTLFNNTGTKLKYNTSSGFNWVQEKLLVSNNYKFVYSSDNTSFVDGKSGYVSEKYYMVS